MIKQKGKHKTTIPQIKKTIPKNKKATATPQQNKAPSHGPAERRASVKACAQKHRSALSFCILFCQEKSMNKIRPLTFLIKQKGKITPHPNFFFTRSNL
ncbi:MAG: hypothetical protein NT021_06080 [Sphingobacteriales bacterium]|nr:hypothetical protein [Sphingobacteriales bacterium]